MDDSNQDLENIYYYMRGIGRIADDSAESPYPTLSHDFEQDSAQSLLMATDGFAGYDPDVFALSCWFKRESTGTNDDMINDISDFQVGFNTSNKLRLVLDGSERLVSTGTFTDTTNWHHSLAIHDITQASGSKQQLWIDGVRLTDFDTESELTTGITPSASNCIIGGNSFDGLMYQWILFSGGYPTAAELYNGGTPRDMRLLANKWAALDPDTSVVSDYVLATDWTNNNTVTTSSDIPVAAIASLLLVSASELLDLGSGIFLNLGL